MKLHLAMFIFGAVVAANVGSLIGIVPFDSSLLITVIGFGLLYIGSKD